MKETPSGADGGQPSSSSRAPGRDGQGGERRRDSDPGRDDLPDQRGDQEDMEYDMEKIPSFEEYMQNRVFTFVHHFSGREDRLAAAIQAEAKRRSVRVECISVDTFLGDDLLSPEPFEQHLGRAARGEIDGFHAGWPCWTFSRLRWRASPGLPGPVRSRSAPNGFMSNTGSQQGECDRGTLMLARSLAMAQNMADSRGPGVGGAFYTLENPPPSEHAEHISAWEMAEYRAFAEKYHPIHVDFNTCCYEEDVEMGKRHFKPQRFAGATTQW